MRSRDSYSLIALWHHVCHISKFYTNLMKIKVQIMALRAGFQVLVVVANESTGLKIVTTSLLSTAS